ncbi:hypothetical protein J7F03_06385 [Streptomyces sp. ISL-43]|uniref:hypothetical protein n=1 Tax=Streptomyces sp. ISL-43 TaxID=2819183 RepID=UPI001BE9B2B7|nr:hypothetical protein [Streptomyces sp. ISL-43]MBT2446709.1 hypothetical protein [Streptomyces sp. ISL-43]
MAFTVVCDACVLYPSTLRDLRIRIAQAGLVQAKWTDRIRDFPNATLEAWNVEAVSADDFVLAQIDLDRQRVFAAVQQIADSWRSPPGTTGDVLDRLERDGLLAKPPGHGE